MLSLFAFSAFWFFSAMLCLLRNDSLVEGKKETSVSCVSNHAAFRYESVHANKQLCFRILDNLPI